MIVQVAWLPDPRAAGVQWPRLGLSPIFLVTLLHPPSIFDIFTFHQLLFPLLTLAGKIYYDIQSASGDEEWSSSPASDVLPASNSSLIYIKTDKNSSTFPFPTYVHISCRQHRECQTNAP